MKVSDIAMGLALLVFAVAIFAYAQTFPKIHGQPYGAGAFPAVIATGLGAFSLILAWRGWRGRRRGSAPLVEWADWARRPQGVLNFALAVLLVVLYVLLSEQIGFIPIATAILLVLFLRQGVQPLLAIAVAVVMAVVIHVGFADFLRVPLPRGLLDGVLW